MGDQTKYTNKLDGQRVLVIGGSTGIGYGVAEACLEHNCTVTISSSSPSRVSEAVSALQASYPSKKDRIHGHACGLADEKTLESNIKELFNQTGEVDHVVFTAGDSPAIKSFRDISFAEIKQAGMVRFFAPMLVVKEAVHHLPASNKSSITLTGGSISERPHENWIFVGAYAGGLKTVSRAFALEVKPVRVNLVIPGAIDTPFWSMLGEADRAAMFKSFEASHPTGAVAKVSDVAEAYIYCMKDRNVTGSWISTDSGSGLV